MLRSFLRASVERLFVPKKRIWNDWNACEADSGGKLHHEAWGRFLAAHLEVGECNLLRYAEVSVRGREELEGYISGLAAVPIRSFSRAEQRAFWINLYNAATVRLVLTHYPIASIRGIRSPAEPFGSGPWNLRIAIVEGRALTLNDIEHRILRPIWNDARLHYGLNCAARGCPNLQPVAFTAQNTEELLEAGARQFVNGRGVRRTKTGLILSSLYRWFIEDFGDGRAGLLHHLARYADGPLAAALARAPRIYGYAYDWALNDARPPNWPALPRGETS